MKKRLLTITAGVIAAVALSIPAYAMPAEAILETPSLTYRDVPGMESPNPGPFPPQATERDLAEFEVSEKGETSDEGETPADSEEPAPSEPLETPESPESEFVGEPETPENPNLSSDPADPSISEEPVLPETPDEPEIPSITDETIAADVSAIRESLGVYIESQRPFFADDTEKQYFFDSLAAIRKDLDFLLYAVIPISAAVLIIYKFCIWFYRTFVESALE